MKIFDRLYETLTRALGLSALALPWNDGATSQHPLSEDLGPSIAMEIDEPPLTAETVSSTRFQNEDMSDFVPELPEGPIFKPPNSSPGFTCDYSAMKGWKHTAGPGARTQWLERPNSREQPDGGVFDIWTDYEAFSPTGTVRQVFLNVTDHDINADGVERPDGGKMFNDMYPGPLIEACWGDTLNITVENHLRYNGTTVHWHGVRQFKSFQMDGVNAVTQCPIAPGKSFAYKFDVTQYGTSWYHSHYSLQYANGLAGPMTFHGPSSADYDEALEPFLISDWSHNSAFQDFSAELRPGKNKPNMTSVILNGRGSFNCTLAKIRDSSFNTKACNNTHTPPMFEQIFQRGRRYLIRLINTSVATTFIFSVDKHMLQIVGMDFVPIEPYYRDSILIGIGQRYHVLVEAKPSNDRIPVEDQNYWIRAVIAMGCGGDRMLQPHPQIGIIRYNSGNTKTPTTKAYQFSTECSDEPYESLVPIVPRYVGDYANNITQDFYNVETENPSQNYTAPHGNFSRGPRVERSAVPRDISVDYSLVNQQDAYPITITVEGNGGREIPPKVNGHSVCEDLANGHSSSKETNGFMEGLTNWHEGKNQSQMKSNGVGACHSKSQESHTRAENGSANGTFESRQGQPAVAFKSRTNGAATHATDSTSESTTNGTSEPERSVETIKAKYLLGCDGARSWIRQQFGIPLEGNQTQNVWGVIDIIPLTNFPDIRQTCVIRSATHGSILIAPREGRLARLYIQLNEASGKDGNLPHLEITPALILEAAQKIMKPYMLEFKYLDWWSVYKIQQRVASKFNIANRIFLAGDAIHIHSPKLGQGMNVSMQDTYNLGWKVCSVIKGIAREEVLTTYETERRQVALDLIAVDHKIANYYSQKSLEDLNHRLDYQSLRDSLYEFLSGAAVNYGPSILTMRPKVSSSNGETLRDQTRLPGTSPLASKLNIGMRIPSYRVINHADARCVHLGELLQSDGRWRIVTFAGDLTNAFQFQRVQRFGEFLAASGSVIRRYTPADQPIDSVIEILTVHSGPRIAVDLLSLHDVFHPYDETLGWNYWKVVVDEPPFHEGFDDIYGKYGIDRQHGCLVICRPDQHIGCVLDLEDFLAVCQYFERILIPVA